MSRSVSAPSSVTKTSPCWNGLIVPGSTLRYGSNFCTCTLRPRDFSSRPSEAAVMPLPRDETTPPVTKTYLALKRGWRPAGDPLPREPTELQPSSPSLPRRRMVRGGRKVREDVRGRRLSGPGRRAGRAAARASVAGEGRAPARDGHSDRCGSLRPQEDGARGGPVASLLPSGRGARTARSSTARTRVITRVRTSGAGAGRTSDGGRSGRGATCSSDRSDPPAGAGLEAAPVGLDADDSGPPVREVIGLGEETPRHLVARRAARARR